MDTDDVGIFWACVQVGNYLSTLSSIIIFLNTHVSKLTYLCLDEDERGNGGPLVMDPCRMARHGLVMMYV